MNEVKTKEIFMYGLGGLIAICFFIVVGLLVFKQVPESNEKLIYMLIGALVGSFGTIVNYFYGSSKGSADKNDIISKK